ncbi:metallophosphoesterase family protein [Lutimonas sp.]|uniref:metallophosphoesterase family protein n=1 Tax=Lutimonas sp. TaxID=1872403 RepID=UPI003D9BD0A5
MKKVAFICDIHLDEKNPVRYGVDSRKNWERILKDIRMRTIDEVIIGGDIGAASAYEWFFNTLKGFDIKVLLGNHDAYSEVSNYYSRGQNTESLFYSEKNASHKLIYLDSSSKKIEEDQLHWLANEIKTASKIVIFTHHPILKVATPIDRKHPLLNRDVLIELLLDSEKDITIFCGHYHMNHEEKFKNIRQIITHSSSFQVLKKADAIEVDASEFGYRMIRFEKGNIESDTITLLKDSTAE